MSYTTEDSEQLTEEQAATLAEFKKRLGYAQQHFRFGREIESSNAGFNESLEMLDQAIRHPRRKRRIPKQMHPQIGILISHRARRIAQERGEDRLRGPGQDDVERAAAWVLANIKPRRGRPADTHLQYHVEAMMCLCEWASGRPVTASTAPHSFYNPQLTSVGADVIWRVLNFVDPKVTKTAVANIIIAARQSRALKGKCFRDYFPLYGGHIDRETGWPVMPPGTELQSFEVSYPIYSS